MSALLNLVADDRPKPVTPAKRSPGITFLPDDDEVSEAKPAEPARVKKGLFSAVAPDPMAEISAESEPDIPVQPENEAGQNRFKRLALSSASNDNAGRYVDVDMNTGDATVSLVTEEEFIEFWSVDAYEMVSDLFALMRLDLSDIQTDEDEIEQGRKAAKHLWKASQRFKWLEWMRMEGTVRGGDLFIAMAFFIGKGAMAVRAIKKHKAKKRAADQATLKPQKQKKKPQVIEGESEVVKS